MVYLVGAGPGDAGLLTLRGAELLQRADVVVYDALANPELLRHAPASAEFISRGKNMEMPQAEITATIIAKAKAGKMVVRLKGGDPSVFGRLEEELEALAQAGIACEVVPGITAAIAAAAAAQRPLTRRGTGRSVSFTTAMTRSGEVQATRSADTEVFYMAGKQLAALSRRLIEAGWPSDTPASVVSRAGWPDQLHSDHTVATLARASLLHAGRPSVVTVGAGAKPLRSGGKAREREPSQAIQPHIPSVRVGSLNP